MFSFNFKYADFATGNVKEFVYSLGKVVGSQLYVPGET